MSTNGTVSLFQLILKFFNLFSSVGKWNFHSNKQEGVEKIDRFLNHSLTSIMVRPLKRLLSISTNTPSTAAGVPIQHLDRELWRTLEDSGGLWRSLEDSGGLWRTLEHPRRLWSVQVHDIIYRCLHIVLPGTFPLDFERSYLRSLLYYRNVIPLVGMRILLSM